MRKLFEIILTIVLSLVGLFIIEYCATAGRAFDFSKYDLYGWFIQFIAIVISISYGFYILYLDRYDEKF